VIVPEKRRETKKRIELLALEGDRSTQEKKKERTKRLFKEPFLKKKKERGERFPLFKKKKKGEKKSGNHCRWEKRGGAELLRGGDRSLSLISFFPDRREVKSGFFANDEKRGIFFEKKKEEGTRAGNPACAATLKPLSGRQGNKKLVAGKRKKKRGVCALVRRRRGRGGGE